MVPCFYDRLHCRCMTCPCSTSSIHLPWRLRASGSLPYVTNCKSTYIWIVSHHLVITDYKYFSFFLIPLFLWVIQLSSHAMTWPCSSLVLPPSTCRGVSVVTYVLTMAPPCFVYAAWDEPIGLLLPRRSSGNEFLVITLDLDIWKIRIGSSQDKYDLQGHFTAASPCIGWAHWTTCHGVAMPQGLVA